MDIEEVMARALAEHTGPLPFDELPADKARLRQWVRKGDVDVDCNTATQDDLRELASVALSALKEAGYEVVPSIDKNTFDWLRTTPEEDIEMAIRRSMTRHNIRRGRQKQAESLIREALEILTPDKPMIAAQETGDA